jgi:hypothetical protein
MHKRTFWRDVDNCCLQLLLEYRLLTIRGIHIWKKNLGGQEEVILKEPYLEKSLKKSRRTYVRAHKKNLKGRAES